MRTRGNTVAVGEAIQTRKVLTQAQREALSRLLRSAMCRSLAMTGGGRVLLGERLSAGRTIPPGTFFMDRRYIIFSRVKKAAM
ncbi:MAG: hypothetical protein LBT00_11005 [Spirochaetaceae bacterium]|nr:hypothetical protein [Spirochaetaceae bacterium]